MGQKSKGKKKNRSKNIAKNEPQVVLVGCEHLQDSLNLKKLMSEISKIERLCETCPFSVADDRVSVDDCSSEDKDVKPEQGSHISDDDQISSGPELGVHQKTAPTVRDVWLCLLCLRKGCSRYDNSHALGHFERQSRHCVSLSLTTFSCWCYKCDDEIAVTAGHPLVDYIFALKKRFAVNSSASSVNGDVESLSSDLTTSSANEPVSKPAKKKLQTRHDIARAIPYNVKGLRNIGNTCFFNSTLQCLFHSSHIEKDLSLRTQASTYTIPCQKDSHLSSATVPLPSSERCLTSSTLLDVFNEMNTSVNHLVVPNQLFNQMCLKIPRFRGNQQQDAHELLRHLLDSVKSEELGRIKSAIQDKLFPRSCKTSDETAAMKRITEVVGNSTLIDDYFGGEIVDTIVCLECHSINTVLQHFLDLSLPLRKPTVDNNSARKNDIHDKENRRRIRQERKQRRKAKEYKDGEWKENNDDDNDEEVQRVLALSMESGIATQSTLGRPDSGLGSGSSGSDQVDTSALDGFPPNSTPTECEELVDENLLASIAALQIATRESFPSSQRMSNKELRRRLQTMGNRPPPEEFEKSVYSALYWYTEREELKNENRYACDQCQQKHGNKNYVTEGTKQTLLAKPPRILTLHLKRFEQVESRRSMILQKISEHIEFPAELDIAPFLSREGVTRHWKEAKALFSDDPLPFTVTYSLRGVVEHIGSLNSGHYVAHVRPRHGTSCSVSDEWFTISDGDVRSVSLDNVLRSKAYILFYELDLKS